MAQNSNDEIDLGVIFTKLKEAFRGFLLFIYNCIQFAIKFWIILLVLIVGGAIAGYFWTESTEADKSANIIIQTNFKSTNYVYDALELLKKKRSEPSFLKPYGFDTENAEIADIEILPIVNIIDLMERTIDEDRSLEEYMAKTDFEDDVLLSELFYSDYDYHRIVLTTTSNGSKKTIESLLNYLNSNELYEEIKVVHIEEAKKQIEYHERSIQDIDMFFRSFADSTKIDIPATQVYYKNNETNNLHFLLEEKRNIMKEIERLKVELLKYDNTVTVMNKPNLIYSYSILDQKTIILPFLLVFFFVFAIMLIKFYKYLKGLSENN